MELQYLPVNAGNFSVALVGMARPGLLILNVRWLVKIFLDPCLLTLFWSQYMPVTLLCRMATFINLLREQWVRFI